MFYFLTTSKDKINFYNVNGDAEMPMRDFQMAVKSLRSVYTKQNF